jgi:hypothetical protein
MVAVIETGLQVPDVVIFEFEPNHQSSSNWKEEGWESREEYEFRTSEEYWENADLYDLDSSVPTFFKDWVSAQEWAEDRYEDPTIIG